MSASENVALDGPWFGVRLIFRVLNDGEPSSTYEERITIWRADSAEKAINLAEAEAVEYVSIGDEPPLLEYLGLAQSFRTFIPDRPIESGDEVFSLRRDSHLKVKKYLNKFFDTGSEHQGTVHTGENDSGPDGQSSV